MKRYRGLGVVNRDGSYRKRHRRGGPDLGFGGSGFGTSGGGFGLDDADDDDSLDWDDWGTKSSSSSSRRRSAFAGMTTEERIDALDAAGRRGPASGQFGEASPFAMRTALPQQQNTASTSSLARDMYHNHAMLAFGMGQESPEQNRRHGRRHTDHDRFSGAEGLSHAVSSALDSQTERSMLLPSLRAQTTSVVPDTASEHGTGSVLNAFARDTHASGGMGWGSPSSLDHIGDVPTRATVRDQRLQASGDRHVRSMDRALQRDLPDHETYQGGVAAPPCRDQGEVELRVGGIHMPGNQRCTGEDRGGVAPPSEFSASLHRHDDDDVTTDDVTRLRREESARDRTALHQHFSGRRANAAWSWTRNHDAKPVGVPASVAGKPEDPHSGDGDDDNDDDDEPKCAARSPLDGALQEAAHEPLPPLPPYRKHSKRKKGATTTTTSCKAPSKGRRAPPPKHGWGRILSQSSADAPMGFDDPEWSGTLFALSDPHRTEQRNADGSLCSLETSATRVELDRDPERQHVPGPESTRYCNVREWTWIADNTHTDTSDKFVRHQNVDDAWRGSENAARCCEVGKWTTLDPLHKDPKHLYSGAAAQGLWSALCRRAKDHGVRSRGRAPTAQTGSRNKHVLGKRARATRSDDSGDDSPPSSPSSHGYHESDGEQDSHEPPAQRPEGQAPSERPAFVEMLRAKIEELAKRATREQHRDRDKRVMRPRIEVEQIDPRQDLSVEGMKWLDLCYKYSDAFKDQRSPDQIEFHDAIYQTCAPHIVGKQDFPRVRQQLMRRFGRTESNMAALIMTPRRWGKTTAVSMAMACIMYTARGVNILVFSTGQDMSTVLMDKVRMYFLELPDAVTRVCEDNKKSFLVTYAGTPPTANRQRLRAANMVNRMLARAATVKGNKGVSFDIAVLEEASRIDMGVLHEVIAPMMKVGNSVLIALSTHLGEENYYTKLFESKHPATKRLFLRLRVELMCAKCKRAGVDPENCHHLDHQHPPWLLGSNAERVKLLMEGNQKMYAQEVLGVVMSDQRSIFQDAWIQALRDRPTVALDNTHGCYITTMIDPAGSGESFTAICSVVRLPGSSDIIIVGMAEADPLNELETQTMIDAYFDNLMRDPVLRKLDHIICCENNYGGPVVANVYWRMCQANNPRLWEYRSNGVSGVVTNQNNKMAAALSAQFDLWKNHIHFYDPLVCLSPMKSDMDVVKDEFLGQLGRMHKEFTGRGTWSYSGKDNQGGRDDIAICALFACHYSKLIAAKSEARRQYIEYGKI